jgi:hypothetical protein
MPWTDAGVALVSAVKYIISIEDSESSMLVIAHAFKVKYKGKRNTSYHLYFQPNLT